MDPSPRQPGQPTFNFKIPEIPAELLKACKKNSKCVQSRIDLESACSALVDQWESEFTAALDDAQRRAAERKSKQIPECPVGQDTCSAIKRHWESDRRALAEVIFTTSCLKIRIIF